MKTRNDELQDLFFAVKKHLLSCGRNLSTSLMVATKVIEDVEKHNTSIEDIRAMRDVFLA
nr:MAG TPA: FRUCTOSE-LIKE PHOSPHOTRANSFERASE ENZYME IIB COMPONENT, EIIB(fruc), alpha/beta, phosphoryl group [Caudoviricetes sp.]